MLSVTMLLTVGLSAFSTWNERTLPPRSTSDDDSACRAPMLAALGVGAARGLSSFFSFAQIGFVGFDDAAGHPSGLSRRRAWLRGYGET